MEATLRAGVGQRQRRDRRRHEGDDHVRPVQGEMVAEPPPEAGVLAHPEDAVHREGVALAPVQILAGLVDLQPQAAADRPRGPEVGVLDAEAERVEGRLAAELVGQDLDLMAAGGERVGGLDQHPLGTAAAVGDLLDHEADLADPAVFFSHCRSGRRKAARRQAAARKAARRRW
jgi:hypothetical protein